MKFSKMITTIDTHTQGEPTRIVTAGIGPIPGTTMSEKKEWMSENNDNLRQMLMWEPRGHENMFGAVITEPCNAKAHVGVIFMDSGGVSGYVRSRLNGDCDGTIGNRLY